MNFICYMLPDQAILQKHGFMHCRRPAAVSAVVLSRGGSGAAGGGTVAAIQIHDFAGLRGQVVYNMSNSCKGLLYGYIPWSPAIRMTPKSAIRMTVIQAAAPLPPGGGSVENDSVCAPGYLYIVNNHHTLFQIDSKSSPLRYIIMFYYGRL